MAANLAGAQFAPVIFMFVFLGESFQISGKGDARGFIVRNESREGGPSGIFAVLFFCDPFCDAG